MDRLLCRKLLEKDHSSAYDIHEAEDVPSALAQCQTLRPDCVLLDYHLQGHIGAQWIQSLKDSAEAPHLPVIMLTGMGDESVAAEAILNGAADYIPKTRLTVNSLERSISNALQKARLEGSVERERHQREQAHEQLAEKSEELQSLYQTVSHELKTPLTAAREFVSLLLDGIGGPLSDIQREYLEITRECCDNLSFLLNNWLDSVRSETGKLVLNKTPASLARLVDVSVKTYAILADKQQITLKLEVSGDLPEIEIDEPRIVQTVANLLSNAIKFSDPGSTISVTCGATDDELFVEVADNGRGIAQSQQAQIFGAFYQSEAEDTSHKNGMGLGLHVSKTIVEMHGGRITLSSKPGEGSRFRVWLPRGSNSSEVTPNE